MVDEQQEKQGMQQRKNIGGTSDLDRKQGEQAGQREQRDFQSERSRAQGSSAEPTAGRTSETTEEE